jgi:hypothetical protein
MLRARSHRRLSASVAAVAITLSLAACSGLSPQPATTPISIPKIAPTAAPGSTLPLRSAVTVNVLRSGQRVPLGVAVLAAFSADASYWDSVPNGSKYRGLIPVWLVVQYRWPSVQVTPQLAFEPTTRDGSTAKPLITSLIGGNTACGIRLEDSRDIKPTGMECELIAMRHPTQLKSVEYRGATITDVVAPDPAKIPYVRSPLSWVFPKGAVPVPAAAADPDD